MKGVPKAWRREKGSRTKIKPVKNQPLKNPPLTPEIPEIKTLSKHYLFKSSKGSGPQRVSTVLTTILRRAAGSNPERRKRRTFFWQSGWKSGKANLLLLGLTFVSYLSLAIAYVFVKLFQT